MGNAIPPAIPAIGAAISAVQLVNWMDPVDDQAPELRDLLLLASAAGFTVSVAFTYRHLHRGNAAAAEEGGGGNRRLPEIVSFALCVCAGVLQYFLFVQAPAAGDPDAEHDAPQLQAARALGLAAVRVLPAAATVSFFLGALLIVAGHIRSGGEGGGTVAPAVAVAGEEEPIQGQAPPPLGLIRLRLLSRMALAAAAGTLCLMCIAVYGAYY